MKTALIGVALALAFSLLLWRLDHVSGKLDAERTAHAATAQECNQWKATAKAYQKDATAHAENARLCLDREAKAARDTAERAAIMRQAAPRTRTETEKGQVVDNETRACVADRLNRPL